MLDYCQFLRSQIPDRIKPRNTPGDPTPVNYGQKEQFIEEEEEFQLNDAEINQLQVLVGQYGWYAKQIAHDMLPHVSILSTHQSKPSKRTKPSMEAIQGYLKRWGNQKLRFYASDMILTMIADASLGTEVTKDGNHRSRGAVFCYLGTKNPYIINGPIMVHTGILPGVPISAAEAEILNNIESGQAGIYIRQILDDLGYKQPTTLILTDNLCVKGYAEDTIKGTKLRHIDR